jgi:hypothetical protein
LLEKHLLLCCSQMLLLLITLGILVASPCIIVLNTKLLGDLCRNGSIGLQDLLLLLIGIVAIQIDSILLCLKLLLVLLLGALL